MNSTFNKRVICYFIYSSLTPLLIYFTKTSLFMLPLIIVLFSLASVNIKRKRIFYLGCFLGILFFTVAFTTILFLITLLFNPKQFITECLKDTLYAIITILCFTFFSLFISFSVKHKEFFYGLLFGMIWLLMIISPPLVNILTKCNDIISLLLIITPVYLIPLIILDYKKPNIIRKIHDFLMK